MTKDEILGMARKAGCVEDKHYKGEVIFISNDALERFAQLVAAAEQVNWPAEIEAMERQVNILTDELSEAEKEIQDLYDITMEMRERQE